MVEDKLSVDEFRRNAEAEFLAFVAHFESAAAEGVDGFFGHHALKTREEWWQEVATYYLEGAEVKQHG